MPTFTNFLSTFDADPRRRGHQFELFVKWFLKNDPRWATQVAEVWLWSDYPNNWGRDKGIDLVFKDRIERLWAVQAKCYSPDYQITKADLDTFLSETSRKHIDHRLLIATTDRLGSNGREVLDGQEKPVVRFLLNDFESAAVDYPDAFEHLAAAKPKPKPRPRPHQIEAVTNIVSGFESSSRGQVVMACGTGKTFVCLWAKERLKSKRTLVLLPSLGLLSQTLSEWTYAAQEPFDALCVCSDQTVGRRDSGEAIGTVSELPFPVTNDMAEIASYLEADRPQVIFSTYQSSPLIAAVQADKRIPSFDLIIADEAHRCAGKADTAFYTPLDDEKIRAEKRLFATATPRIYRTSLKKAAEDFGVEVADMNDELIFGRRFHTLSFGEAIRRELLTDYRVLIVGVDNTMVAEWIKTRRLVSTEAGHNTDAESLAAQIAVLKAMKDWDLHRIISFHGRVKRAKEFSEDVVRVSAWLDEKHKPSGTLWSDYVSGEMPTITRKRKLQRLKSVGNREIGLLSNARCLSEGVDVPALDGVAFIDPRGSEIDIIQSVGRAIRLSKDKTIGTIVIPVFVDRNEDAETALRSSHFKPIWDVLEALKSHDERLSNELDQLRIEMGARRRRSIGKDDLTKVFFDLPTTVTDTFAECLRVQLVERTTASWMFWLGALEQYQQDYGHCRVPAAYQTDEGFKLGVWVGSQRAAVTTMDPDRRSRLEAITGWTWDIPSAEWEEGFSHLKEFVNSVGHCTMPAAYKTEGGFCLGRWVVKQRTNRDDMDTSRRARLEQLPGWSWSPLADAWENGFRQLKAYVEREGHCNVPQPYRTDDGFKLGSWLSNQRFRRARIDPVRQERLESFPMWSWDTLHDSWERNLTHLFAFAEREGHCRVPRDYRTGDGTLLGLWVSNQRTKRATLDVSRRQRLDGIPGWTWDTLSADWEDGFSHLKEYSLREGHCRVPALFKTDGGFRLGRWVVHQREIRDSLHSERRERLESLSGWTWDVLSASWDEGFSQLKAFFTEKGHCRVPALYKNDNGYPLGQWVRRQRVQRESLDSERLHRLESLQGWIWKVRD